MECRSSNPLAAEVRRGGKKELQELQELQNKKPIRSRTSLISVAQHDQFRMPKAAPVFIL
jgi:hypothetical protein